MSTFNDRLKRPDAQSKRRQQEADNLQAARLILTDIDAHGGESALCVRWSRLYLKVRSQLDNFGSYAGGAQ
jgi:hypothetical protein